MMQLPKAYSELVDPLIDIARGILEQGESLQPVAFVGNFTQRRVVPLMLDTSSDEAKQLSVRTIRQAAKGNDADFVALVMESWGLPTDMMPRYEEVIAEYGSIGASPFRQDAVTITIETRHGVWLAQLELKPVEGSSQGRTFDTPVFQLAGEVAGRFTGLLPKVEEQSLPGLH